MRALLTLGLIAAIGYTTNGSAEPANTAFPPSKQREVHAVVVDEPQVNMPQGSGEISDLVEPSGQAVETVSPDRTGPDALDLLRISSPTNIRSGPSPSAEIIGIAPAGASVRAAARSSDWVLIVDPWSGETGWIHSQSLAPFSAIQLRCSLPSWLG
jgi:Bacterial SH3 domain